MLFRSAFCSGVRFSFSANFSPRSLSGAWDVAAFALLSAAAPVCASAAIGSIIAPERMNGKNRLDFMYHLWEIEPTACGKVVTGGLSAIGLRCSANPNVELL